MNHLPEVPGIVVNLGAGAGTIFHSETRLSYFSLGILSSILLYVHISKYFDYKKERKKCNHINFNPLNVNLSFILPYQVCLWMHLITI